jgi:predicted RNase H-like HicB family nuclease
MQLSAVTQREDDVFVSHCPELDIASQGATPEEAHANLKEAVEGFLEVASQTEIARRLVEGAQVMPLEVAA